MADDDNLELKKRARRRLVGAAALALLAAIVLPMVMDQEPRPLNQDVQIQIPRQEGDNFAARPIVPHSDTAPPVAANPDTPAEPESPGSSAPPPRAVAAPAGAVSESAAAATKPEVPKPAAPKPEAVKAEPTKTAPAAAAEGSRAEAILSGKAETYVVQLGAYKDEANVASLRAKLKDEGFATYTEKIADKTRVRVGPYPTRDAAEKAANRLRQLGLNGVVTVR